MSPAPIFYEVAHKVCLHPIPVYVDTDSWSIATKNINGASLARRKRGKLPVSTNLAAATILTKFKDRHAFMDGPHCLGTHRPERLRVLF